MYVSLNSGTHDINSLRILLMISVTCITWFFLHLLKYQKQKRSNIFTTVNLPCLCCPSPMHKTLAIQSKTIFLIQRGTGLLLLWCKFRTITANTIDIVATTNVNVRKTPEIGFCNTLICTYDSLIKSGDKGWI